MAPSQMPSHMPSQKLSRRDVTRDITYAHSASSKAGRAVIRVIENSTGRLGLIKRAQGYEAEVAAGRDFWSVMVDRYGLGLEIFDGALSNIPRNGPVILIANHPYGILDGLMMGHILSQARGDFRILANSVFCKAEALNRIVLPISFDASKEAALVNLQTRKDALSYLRNGGAMGVFPGGTVSTAERPFGQPLDPGWRHFTARLIAQSDATVVPVYFDGHTSRMFQIASHLHSTLRLGLLIKEFKTRVDTPVRLAIGNPIGRDVLNSFHGDSKQMMDFLRKATYELSPSPNQSFDLGYEFETKLR
ncbi:lysophospholipid acyltransferase family protein [Ascidiaceihabitans sp.]|uniref:lysophospholipid acyltransferase family protein n=1 Tax=Ascidiaceihabitans sp. TaxID=1872644 RepID=UPI0032986C8B